MQSFYIVIVILILLMVVILHARQNAGASEVGYSLKERQVSRLRMEMQHPGGVRIVLKKKDCLNTIAFIDGLGTVWYSLAFVLYSSFGCILL